MLRNATRLFGLVYLNYVCLFFKQKMVLLSIKFFFSRKPKGGLWFFFECFNLVNFDLGFPFGQLLNLDFLFLFI